MNPREIWIWLPKAAYPGRQTTFYTPMQPDHGEGNFTVCAFEREYAFDRPIARLTLRFSGDSALRLTCNGQMWHGPATAGGDFLFNDLPRQNFYASLVELNAGDLGGDASKGILRFRADVRMMPAQICEYSRGHGGFMLWGKVEFEDGTHTYLSTDASWKVKLLASYTDACTFDGTAADGDWTEAEQTPNVWYAETAPIPPCTENIIYPEGGKITVPAGKTVTVSLPLDKIYAGNVVCDAKCSAPLKVQVSCSETGENGSGETLTFCGEQSYHGFCLHSAGQLNITAENTGDTPAEVNVGFAAVCYPTDAEAETVTSDAELNQVFRTCAHTLKYCRQTHHLDSPRHCEPMACTGDYYIETLMTVFTFGDLRLAAFDVRRTAELLRYHDGRMFHTTYSLIWVQMLWDVYRYTGEKALLTDCEEALTLLLERFRRYYGDNGILETPPDYMFIDWLNPDGISLHHPPKALGQTCLNLFYYGALKTAADIYREMGDIATADKYLAESGKLHDAVYALLWDKERGLFFEGLNTPTVGVPIYGYMPQNVEKRYYRRHANILACYFRFFEEKDAQALLRRIAKDDSLDVVQPYFMHFWLEAIYRNGLRDELTLPLLNLWKAPVMECPKGLAEGFYKPEPTYRFDHSHAWGGTAAYALPLALTGLEVTKPGFGAVRLSPSLLGLDQAKAEIPTPYGMITVEQVKGEEPRITVPAGITLEA